jgi:hypothetical protein
MHRRTVDWNELADGIGDTACDQSIGDLEASQTRREKL